MGRQSRKPSKPGLKNFREALILICGSRRAHRLMELFGGQVVRIPYAESAAARKRQERNRLIVDALGCSCPDESHHSYSGVARRFHMSRSTVQRASNT